ncbi:MAG: hypothetical protein A3H35_08755 [Betaproteobacteria bacterium RIFCSPLOWO2_02_FULL_62_17]|nr:MAG: hypothetical protein A3H35_08755 [Betaproteobacteria bacterium RIFCSPLOWO2_02_FULL_62_17]
MCLILFAHRAQAGVNLLLAANRDEFFVRPTLAAAWWPDHPDILAGRDLQAGGTWLGVTRSGRFAAITNFRDPASRRDDAPSRGDLVGDFLLGTESPAQYLGRISAHADRHNGFSLLAGQGDELWFLSNRGNGLMAVQTGVHGLSNHLLDEPWPKVTRGTARLARQMPQPFAAESYFKLLADEEQAPDSELPSTGIDLERERRSSAIRIRDAVYGTRCSTLLRITAAGAVEFHERSFTAAGEVSGTVSHRFAVR